MLLVDGDTGPNIPFTYTPGGLDTFLSITLTIKQPDCTAVEIAATISTDTTGYFVIPTGALVPGVSSAEVKMVNAAGQISRYPKPSPLQLLVRDNLE